MWRFYLLEVPSGRWVDKDLPLTGAQVIESLSAPASISGTLRLGYPVVPREWGHALVAEQEGSDPVFAIIDRVSEDADSLKVEAGGFSMYPTGTPWMGADFAGVQVDPLDMVRKIWAHLQSFPDGNLGVAVDGTRSPVRVGTEEKHTEFTTGAGEDVSFDSGPFRLAWWTTDDLGKVFQDLVKNTPFDYRERSRWAGEDLRHRLELGYPRLGARKDDLRFEVGVNVTASPALDETDYASAVLMMGAGEGSTKITGAWLSQSTGRLRRVHVDTDKGLTSKGAATAAARPVLAKLSRTTYSLDSLTVIDHPSARFGTFEPGDEIRVQGNAGWADLDLWVRITEMSTACDTGVMTLKVVTV